MVHMNQGAPNQLSEESSESEPSTIFSSKSISPAFDSVCVRSLTASSLRIKENNKYEEKPYQLQGLVSLFFMNNYKALS